MGVVLLLTGTLRPDYVSASANSRPLNQVIPRLGAPVNVLVQMYSMDPRWSGPAPTERIDRDSHQIHDWYTWNYSHERFTADAI